MKRIVLSILFVFVAFFVFSVDYNYIPEYRIRSHHDSSEENNTRFGLRIRNLVYTSYDLSISLFNDSWELVAFGSSKKSSYKIIGFRVVAISKNNKIVVFNIIGSHISFDHISELRMLGKSSRIYIENIRISQLESGCSNLIASTLVYDVY